MWLYSDTLTMELISKLLLVFIKSMALLLGIALLIGGGLCSISNVVASFSQNSVAMLLFLLISIPIALSGYGLIRWIITKKNELPPE